MTQHPNPELVAPQYGVASLADLVPSVATMLRGEGGGVVGVPEARGVCIVLADGLGAELLRGAGGYANFLRSLQTETGRTLTSGFPSTTATSLGSLGTGLPPGGHGMFGYEVLNPERDTLLNQLSWAPGVDPVKWQSHDTMFQQLEAQGIHTAMVGPKKFYDSGLTLAALRGAKYLAAEELQGRVRRAAKALTDNTHQVVYLYWGDIDTVGHSHGCGSQLWAEELQSFDRAMQRLIAEVPRDCAVIITADHGMVDAPSASCLDIAQHPQLRTDVRHYGGETRAMQLYTKAGSAPDVAARWAAVVGENAWVKTREQAIAAGWFGAVAPQLAARIGDVIVAARDKFGVVDSQFSAPRKLAMIGQHGSLTAAEMFVPMMVAMGQKGPHSG